MLPDHKIREITATLEQRGAAFPDATELTEVFGEVRNDPAAVELLQFTESNIIGSIAMHVMMTGELPDPDEVARLLRNAVTLGIAYGKAYGAADALHAFESDDDPDEWLMSLSEDDSDDWDGPGAA